MSMFPYHPKSLYLGFLIFLAAEVIELIWKKAVTSSRKATIHDKDSNADNDKIVFTLANYNCSNSHERGLTSCGAEFCPYNALHLLTNQISSCKKSLHICVYKLTFPELINAIIKVKKLRKIVVKIIIDDKEDSEGSQKLIKNGISVLGNEYSKGLMHLKSIIIDKEVVITGSFNFTKTALLCQDNNFIITRNKEVVKSALDSFHSTWKANSELKRTNQRLKDISHL